MANTQTQIAQTKNELVLTFDGLIDKEVVEQIVDNIAKQNLCLDLTSNTILKFILSCIIETINEQKTNNYIPVHFFTTKEIMEYISPEVKVTMQNILKALNRRSQNG